MYDYLSDHPDKAKSFANAMRSFAQRPGLEPKYAVEGYPWGTLPDGATGGLCSYSAPFRALV